MKYAKVFKCYWHIKVNDWCLEKILFFAGVDQTHLVDYQLKLRIDYFEILAYEQITT